MNFSEFEKLMNSNGITSLAEIARFLNTTPQAVSNWKARNQIPNHIVLKINSSTTNFINIENNDEMKLSGYPQNNFSQSLLNEINSVSLSDILLIIAQQLKLILLTSFVTVFLTFTFALARASTAASVLATCLCFIFFLLFLCFLFLSFLLFLSTTHICIFHFSNRSITAT